MEMWEFHFQTSLKEEKAENFPTTEKEPSCPDKNNNTNPSGQDVNSQNVNCKSWDEDKNESEGSENLKTIETGEKEEANSDISSSDEVPQGKSLTLFKQIKI